MGRNLFQDWYHGNSKARVTFLRSRRFGMALFTLSRITGRYMSGFRRRQLLRHVVDWADMGHEERATEAAAAVLDREVRAAAMAAGVDLPGPGDYRIIEMMANAEKAPTNDSEFYEMLRTRVLDRFSKFVAWYGHEQQLQVGEVHAVRCCHCVLVCNIVLRRWLPLPPPRFASRSCAARS